MVSTNKKWSVALFTALIIGGFIAAIYFLTSEIENFSLEGHLVFFGIFGLAVLFNQLAYKSLNYDEQNEVNIGK